MGAAAVTVDSFQQQQQQQQQDSDCAIVAGEEDEVMEVTPEVHRDFFTGKHFLLTGNDDRDRSDEGMTIFILSLWTGKLCNGHLILKVKTGAFTITLSFRFNLRCP